MLKNDKLKIIYVAYRYYMSVHGIENIAAFEHDCTNR